MNGSASLRFRIFTAAMHPLKRNIRFFIICYWNYAGIIFPAGSVPNQNTVSTCCLCFLSSLARNIASTQSSCTLESPATVKDVLIKPRSHCPSFNSPASSLILPEESKSLRHRRILYCGFQVHWNHPPSLLSWVLSVTVLRV